MTDYEQRFWSHVRRGSELGDCWEWTYTKVPGGYGIFWGGDGNVRAHRYAYERLVGPIPKGLQLDHLCRNRACVNPDHLEPVTAKENYLRGVGPTAENARKTHCIHGHPFDGDNLYVPPTTGFRRCKVCLSEASKRWAKNKAARIEAESSNAQEDNR